MFSQPRLFYLTVKAHGSKRSQDRKGRRERKMWILCWLYWQGKQLIAICIVGGKLGFQWRQQRIKTTDMEENIPLSDQWIMHYPSLKRLPPLQAHPLNLEVAFGWFSPKASISNNTGLTSPNLKLHFFTEWHPSGLWRIWANRWQWCLHYWPMDPHFSS